MTAMYAQSTFSADHKMSGFRPSTPPYTPARSKRPFERADSPASFTSSIHPQETVSPARKSARRSDTVLDDVKVEELAEGDLADTELIYPHELEEADSDGHLNNSSSSDTDDEDDVGGDNHNGGITGRLSRLHCHDVNGMPSQSRHHSMMPRTDSRVFKRSHSQSAKGDTSDSANMDAMDDHNNPVGARRLRRRVRGPLQQAHLRHDILRSASESIRSSTSIDSPSRGYESAGMIDDSDDDDDDDDAGIFMRRKDHEMDIDDDSE